MGDANSVLSAGEARLLLRRTGFGAKPSDVARIVSRGETRGQVVDRLLRFRPSGFTPRHKHIDMVHNKWVKFMTRTALQLQEKLVLFWHDHLATGNDVVGNARRMAVQNGTLRAHCKGDFRAMMHAINRDPAMMVYLDTVRNRRAVPNENYARELLELFCLGVYDLDGETTYTQEDIVQIARAFTGWRIDDKERAFLNEGQHDRGNGTGSAPYPERGPKVIFQGNSAFGPAGYDFGAAAGTDYAAEIDEVMNAIFAHQDSAGRNTVAHWIAYRLITYFADSDPDNAYVEAMVAASGFDSSFVVADLLRAIFVSDQFYAAVSNPAKLSVKWPVDYVVSTMRLLGMQAKSKYLFVDGGTYGGVGDALSNMGQVLLEPPSVFGWDWESSWINSSTLLARYGFVRDLISARGKGKTALRPERLFSFAQSAGVDPELVVDAVTGLLGVQDSFPPASSARNALVHYLTDGMGGTIDFTDFTTRDKKLRGVILLVAQSPAYMLQ